MIDSSALQIKTDDKGGIPVVAANGDVDLSTAPLLKREMEAAIGSAGKGAILLDIRQVGFIDSAGLALLVDIRKRFATVCKLIVVITAGSQPERVLKLGRFDTFLQVGYSVEEAVGEQLKAG